MKNKRLGLQLWAYSLFLCPEEPSSTHPSKNPVDHELGYRDRFLPLTHHTFGGKQILDRTHRGYTLAVRGAIVEGLLISKYNRYGIQGKERKANGIQALHSQVIY